VMTGHLVKPRCRGCGGPLVKKPGPGRWPWYCPACKAGGAPAEKRRPGPAPQQRTWTDRHGWVWLVPADRRERGYPTSLASGAIKRAHLVWNRAYPGDAVEPGELIVHKNEVADDDRLANLEKRADVWMFGRRHLSDPRPEARGPREHLRTGVCIHGHVLIGDNLYIQPDGKRRCRACNRRRQRQLSPEAHERRKAYWRERRRQR
jgi:hypothetical protein